MPSNMQFFTSSRDQQPEIVVNDAGITIRIYKFNLDGHFTEESQVTDLKAKGTGPKKRKTLFKELTHNGKSITVCKICYTLKKDVEKVAMNSDVIQNLVLKTKSQNHHTHLFRKVHNPQLWGDISSSRNLISATSPNQF